MKLTKLLFWRMFWLLFLERYCDDFLRSLKIFIAFNLNINLFLVTEIPSYCKHYTWIYADVQDFKNNTHTHTITYNIYIVCYSISQEVCLLSFSLIQNFLSLTWNFKVNVDFLQINERREKDISKEKFREIFLEHPPFKGGGLKYHFSKKDFTDMLQHFKKYRYGWIVAFTTAVVRNDEYSWKEIAI